MTDEERKAWEELVENAEDVKIATKVNIFDEYPEYAKDRAILWASRRMERLERVREAAINYKNMIMSGFHHDDHAVAVVEDLEQALREVGEE